MKILNRLGVCASADTLSRYIQYRITTHDNKSGVDLNPLSFVVISANNIDFLHSFSRIFQGNQISSWHGTSVQAVNPRPSLEDETKDGECFVERLADTSVSSHTDNSTVASTHGEATASQSTDDTSFRCAQVHNLG